MKRLRMLKIRRFELNPSLRPIWAWHKICLHMAPSKIPLETEWALLPAAVWKKRAAQIKPKNRKKAYCSFFQFISLSAS